MKYVKLLQKEVHSNQSRQKEEIDADLFAAYTARKAGYNLTPTAERHARNAKSQTRGMVDWANHPPSSMRALIFACEQGPSLGESVISPELELVQLHAKELLAKYIRR